MNCVYRVNSAPCSSFIGGYMDKFGMLTFIGEAGVNKHGQKCWRLRCDCGAETVVVASAVRTGHTASCGCGKHKGNTKHGARRSRLYTIWCNMKARCDNPKHPAFRNYGGRGITYAPEWATFEGFAAGVGAPPSALHTLDRIDNESGYAPGNIRWATRGVQARNLRQNVWVTIGGATKCFHDWCADYDINAASVYRRLAAGEDIVSAITRPKAARFRS